MKYLTDLYNRKIEYVRISVTDRCNLRCKYCFSDNDYIEKKNCSEILSFEEIFFIVKVLSYFGVSKVRITGGEPLIRKDILKLIKKLSSINNIKSITMTTNGTLLSNFAESLKTVGLERVNISLDSLKSEKFFYITGKPYLSEVLQSIEKSFKFGLTPVKLNVVVMKGINDDEIYDFVELTRDSPINVRFIELMPIGNSNWGNDKFIPSSEIIKSIQEKYNIWKLESSIFTNHCDIYKVDNFVGTIGFISPIEKNFCNGCNKIRITADGHLRMCLFSSEEFDIKPIIRNTYSEIEIINFFESCIKNKPKSHNLINSNECSIKKDDRPMVAIGG